MQTRARRRRKRSLTVYGQMGMITRKSIVTTSSWPLQLQSARARSLSLFCHHPSFCIVIVVLHLFSNIIFLKILRQIRREHKRHIYPHFIFYVIINVINSNWLLNKKYLMQKWVLFFRIHYLRTNFKCQNIIILLQEGGSSSYLSTYITYVCISLVCVLPSLLSFLVVMWEAFLAHGEICWNNETAYALL